MPLSSWSWNKGLQFVSTFFYNVYHKHKHSNKILILRHYTLMFYCYYYIIHFCGMLNIGDGPNKNTPWRPFHYVIIFRGRLCLTVCV